MNAYWEQFSHNEIMSMHGVEIEDEREDEDYEMECNASEEEDREDFCPRCGGGGCNWCLMLDY